MRLSRRADLGESRLAEAVSPCRSTEAHFNPVEEAENVVRILQTRPPGTATFSLVGSTLCATSSNELCDSARTWKPWTSATRPAARRDGRGRGHSGEGHGHVTAGPATPLPDGGDPRRGKPRRSDRKPVAVKTRQRRGRPSPGCTARLRPRPPQGPAEPRGTNQSRSAPGNRARGHAIRPPICPHAGSRDRVPFLRDAQ